MNRNFLLRLSLAAVCGFGLAACGNGGEQHAGTDSVVHTKPAASDAELKTSSGKPSPPIRIDYEILGTPVIGLPLSINVNVSSSLEQAITVNYRINDTTSLAFSDAQARTVSIVPVGDESFSAEQVTVIPQREGRLYLNVAAEIDTEIGKMTRSIAIPIQVGSLRPAPKVSGELTEGDAGEALISMPAKED